LIDFIDKTSEQNGTPINRENMMAIQGFIGITTEKQADGSILQTNANGHTLVTKKNTDGSITQTFTGEKVITKKITISNGKITEVVIP
jgi:archaeosine-15-forming tRNA-guanine transglycosylase